jgi:hypothetical protein
MAASAATQEAMWQARLLEQMGMRVDLPIKLYEDNKLAIMFADHPGDHRNTKHIDTRKEFAREAQTFWYYITSVCSYRRTTCRRNDESSTISYLSSHLSKQLSVLL